MRIEFRIAVARSAGQQFLRDVILQGGLTRDLAQQPDSRAQRAQVAVVRRKAVHPLGSSVQVPVRNRYACASASASRSSRIAR